MFFLCNYELKKNLLIQISIIKNRHCVNLSSKATAHFCEQDVCRWLGSGQKSGLALLADQVVRRWDWLQGLSPALHPLYPFIFPFIFAW